MRPFRLFQSPRAKRWLAIFVLALLVMGGGVVSLGPALVREDPLARADAIYVLGGGWVNRWLEAEALYREGWAPLILLSSGGGLGEGDRMLAARGVHLPTGGEAGHDLLVRQLGLPAAAVEVLPAEVDNTAQEAIAIRERVRAAGWHRIIVLTDLATTRRAGFAFRRELGSSVTVIVRASRLDGFKAARWWQSREGVRTVMYETPKLIVYWLGLRG
jgi:uncharacterized SAM-binding protein YcdF (DUF218 family)